MFIVYDLIFIIFAILYIPYLTIRRKWHRGFCVRFGFIPKETIKLLSAKKNIWIHAVSVGEVLAIVDLIEKLKKKFPNYQIVCSTVTKTGYKIASERLASLGVVIFAPLDFSWIIRTFVRAINPQIYIAAETEIWPNLYTYLSRKGIPIVQVNGRISDKAFKGYQKVKWLTRRVLGSVNVFCVQSDLDQERVIALGADPKRVRVFGNIKFDNVPQACDFKLEDLGFTSNQWLLVAGSTHPGEEVILMNTYRNLMNDFPQLRLVLVPRHVERSEEVVALVNDQGFIPVRFSTLGHAAIDAKTIVVVDEIGKLRTLYSLSKIVFIGKTLTVGGGQNMIEPAAFGRAIILGPHTYNFKDVVRIFLHEGALIQVNDNEELLARIKALLRNSNEMNQMGLAAKRIVEKYQGATTKTVEVIEQIIKS